VKTVDFLNEKHYGVSFAEKQTGFCDSWALSPILCTIFKFKFLIFFFKLLVKRGYSNL